MSKQGFGLALNICPYMERIEYIMSLIQILVVIVCSILGVIAGIFLGKKAIKKLDI